jgi:inner membrane protein
MNKSLLLKVIGMLSLITLMSIAVGYINGIIVERQHYQEQVKRQIAKSAAGTQTLVGPILAVPYTEEYVDYVDDFTDKLVKVQKKVTITNHKTAYFLPENIKLTGAFAHEYKKLGIYQALMYQLGGNIQGDFRLPANLNIRPMHKNGVITFKPAYLSIGMSDTRGITGKPILNVGNQSYQWMQGSQIKSLDKGIHAKLGNIHSETAQVIPFSFTFNLQGMEDFHFTPIASTNTVSLKSSWQHPHFNGSFLPVSKAIGSNGFSANWAVSALSSSNQTTLLSNLESNESNTRHDALESLLISFVDPINVYSQADRATKYGLLFIGLTFVGFFLFEILKQLRIHPAQYTLVGLAMAMFYLLLVSFAEMIGFSYAYLTASAACVLLLGYYLSFVLKSKAHGFTFAAFLTALYGALYGILASEDNALIMGSVLMFGLLTIAMVMTRKIDWYTVNTQK